MTREELVDSLGTIARSGTARFAEVRTLLTAYSVQQVSSACKAEVLNVQCTSFTASAQGLNQAPLHTACHSGGVAPLWAVIPPGSL